MSVITKTDMKAFLPTCRRAVRWRQHAEGGAALLAVVGHCSACVSVSAVTRLRGRSSGQVSISDLQEAKASSGSASQLVCQMMQTCRWLWSVSSASVQGPVSADMMLASWYGCSNRAGDETCAVGYHGPLCSVCEDGYFQFSNGCMCDILP